MHSLDRYGPMDRHECATHADIGSRIAALKGFEFAGEYERSADYTVSLYFVPNDSLLSGEAAALGIENEHDLFGGVVPYPFVAGKALSHRLIGPEARAPQGWSHAFENEVHESVPVGFSAFAVEDARSAGMRLLERGPVRVKPVRARAGRGQVVVRDSARLDAALGGIEDAELAVHGLVLEEDLTDVTTFSVGQVRIADLVATYYGTQRLTNDNSGAEVYGGSELVVARGGFDELLSLDPPDDARLAIGQARVYDAAATKHFPGFLASRRNYDVARGLDSAGHERSGVLEQSWRIGGSSSAEIAALEAFRAEPALCSVRASCFEFYGASEDPPAGAIVSFRGTDETVGPITKYTLLEPCPRTLPSLVSDAR